MNPQEKTDVGRHGLQVTRLGLGGAPFAGLYSKVAEEQAQATIKRHLEHGMNFFDTAPLYGSGLSEKRLGAALSDRDRSSFVLATKVGRLLIPDTDRRSTGIWSDDMPPLKAVFDFSYDAALRALEQSLERLGLDRVDILHIHDPDDHYDEAMAGAYRALARLRDEGVVKAIGAGMNQAEMLTRMGREGDFDCFLLAGRYTLLDHVGLRELLPLCVQKNIRIIVGGPYNSGILATGAVEGATFNYAPASPEILERVRRIEAVCRDCDTPLKAAALQFPLAHPAVAAIIPGGRSPAEVDENVALLQRSIPGELWTRLRAQGLIPPEAPVPG
jgi:D-threo-aldose 1-dehydrogenase